MCMDCLRKEFKGLDEGQLMMVATQLVFAACDEVLPVATIAEDLRGVLNRPTPSKYQHVIDDPLIKERSAKVDNVLSKVMALADAWNDLRVFDKKTGDVVETKLRHGVPAFGEYMKSLDEKRIKSGL